MYGYNRYGAFSQSECGVCIKQLWCIQLVRRWCLMIVNCVKSASLQNIFNKKDENCRKWWLFFFFFLHNKTRNFLVIKANEIHNFSNLFDKVLYMFRTGPLSIIRSISTLYTRNRYLSCYFCWLSASRQPTEVAWQISIACIQC